jgi:hypothetical protein
MATLGETLPKVGDGPSDIHPMRARNLERVFAVAKLILNNQSVVSLPQAVREAGEADEGGKWSKEDRDEVLLLIKWWFELVARYKPAGTMYDAYTTIVTRRRAIAQAQGVKTVLQEPGPADSTPLEA